MTALSRALLTALPVALLALVGGHALQGTVMAAWEERASDAAERTTHRIDAEASRLAYQVEQLCRFDRRGQQLELELEGGLRAGDAGRSLHAMRRTAELDRLRVLDARNAQVLAQSPAKPRLAGGFPESATLEEGSLWLHAHCELGRVRTLVGSRRIVMDDAAPENEGHLAWLLTGGASPAPDDEWQRAWPRSSELSVALWVRPVVPERPLALFQAACALTLVLALGLGAWSGMRSARGEVGGAENTALSAIEAAAERVARGDLVSHIGVRTGTSADRTLSAFDRMTEELRATREKLVRAERATAWQDMARRIAHEIKNPLSPIRTAIETLRKAHARNLPDFDEIFEESSQAILEEVDRLQHIVREFSEFARLPKPRPGAIDVVDVAQHAVAIAKHGEACITLLAPTTVPNVRADREQLVQVLLNLLQNACTAAASTRGSAARVELHVTGGMDGVEVAVHDNGPGVPTAERDRLFEPYFTATPGGTGLGLSIAARIVEEHGSKIRVDDSPLGGAVFAFGLYAGAEGTTQT